MQLKGNRYEANYHEQVLRPIENLEDLKVITLPLVQRFWTRRLVALVRMGPQSLHKYSRVLALAYRILGEILPVVVNTNGVSGTPLIMEVIVNYVQEEVREVRKQAFGKHNENLCRL